MAVRWNAGSESTRTYPNGYGADPVLVPKPTYDGEVVGITGDTERIMSDVWEYVRYAMVVHDGKLERVHLSTSGFSADAGDVTIDADDATVAVAHAALMAKETDRLMAAHNRDVDRAAYEATRPLRGKTVVVARGRKVPKGTTGELFWTGAGRFGTRAGVRKADGSVVWTALNNLDVVNPDDYVDLDALRRVPNFDTDARRYADATLASWRTSLMRRAA
jgi:hypothetical protein